MGLRPRVPSITEWRRWAMRDRVNLDALAARPELASELAAPELAQVMAQVAAVSAAVASRLAEEPKPATEPEPVPAQWLTPEEAAAITGLSRRSVYCRSRSKEWAPFVHRVSRKCLRIEEGGLRRWMAVKAAVG